MRQFHRSVGLRTRSLLFGRRVRQRCIGKRCIGNRCIGDHGRGGIGASGCGIGRGSRWRLRRGRLGALVAGADGADGAGEDGGAGEASARQLWAHIAVTNGSSTEGAGVVIGADVTRAGFARLQIAHHAHCTPLRRQRGGRAAI